MATRDQSYLKPRSGEGELRKLKLEEKICLKGDSTVHSKGMDRRARVMGARSMQANSTLCKKGFCSSRGLMSAAGQALDQCWRRD